MNMTNGLILWLAACAILALVLCGITVWAIGKLVHRLRGRS